MLPIAQLLSAERVVLKTVEWYLVEGVGAVPCPGGGEKLA